MAFASGGHKDASEALEIASIAEQTSRDIVYVEFGLPIADGPIGVALATRATFDVEWHPDVRLYTASDDAPIKLLTNMHRWSIRSRSMLTASALPSRNRIKRGIERANRRWRDVAERVHGVTLTGSLFVPAGGRHADAVPTPCRRRADGDASSYSMIPLSSPSAPGLRE